jgi:hypothetical protein
MIEKHSFDTDEEECEDTANGHVSLVKIELELSGSDRNAWFDFLIKKERGLIAELDSDKILRLKNAKDANPIEITDRFIFERYQKSYLELMDANKRSNLKMMLGIISDVASRGITGQRFDEEAIEELSHIMKICTELLLRDRKYRQPAEAEKKVIQ